MYYNRDEFLLLSRSGRAAHSGAGPPSRLYDPGDPLPDRSPGMPWLLRVMGAAVSGMWRHAGDDGRTAGTAAPPADAASDAQETYLELEFAVGFAADDEPWL